MHGFVIVNVFYIIRQNIIIYKVTKIFVIIQIILYLFDKN